MVPKRGKMALCELVRVGIRKEDTIASVTCKIKAQMEKPGGSSKPRENRTPYYSYSQEFSRLALCNKQETGKALLIALETAS